MLLLPHASAYVVMRYASVPAAVGAVLLFVALLRYRLRCSWFAALSAGAGLAISWGFWRYSNEAEVYSWAAFLVLLALWVGLRERSGWAWVVLAATLAALASVIQIQNVIPAVIAVPAFLMLRRRFVHLIVYGAVFGFVGASITLSAYRYTDPPVSYVRYLLPGTSLPTGFEPTSIAAGAVGFGQVLGSGEVLFAYRGVADRLERVFPDQELEQEEFAGRRINPALAALALALFLVTAGLVVVIFVGLLRHGAETRKGYLTRAVPFAAWFVVYWAITSATYASDPEAWILALLPFWALAGILVLDRLKTSGFRRLATAALVGLFAFNVVAGLIPLWPASSDYNARQADWFLEHARPGDAILTTRISLFRYLRYYSEAQVLYVGNLSPGDVGPVSGVVRSAQAAYATEDVLYSPSSQSALRLLRTSIGGMFHRARDGQFGACLLHLLAARCRNRSRQVAQRSSGRRTRVWRRARILLAAPAGSTFFTVRPSRMTRGREWRSIANPTQPFCHVYSVTGTQGMSHRSASISIDPPAHGATRAIRLGSQTAGRAW